MASIAPVFSLLKKARRSRLADLREHVEPILSNRLHTHFTDHSISHSDRVAELVKQLAAPLKGDRKLKDDEAFALYGSCYLHDIGMQNENAGKGGRLATHLTVAGRDWSNLSRDERLDLIRFHHHETSADMVQESVRSAAPPIGLSLSDTDQPGEIAALCEGHCVDPASPRYAQLVQGERSTMRLRLLLALLRMADILDEAHHRALVSQERTLDLNLESRMHWWRHYYTREVVIEPESNRMTVWFGFPLAQRDEYARIIPSLQMPWVEQEVSRHREVLAENGLSWHVGWQVQESSFSTLQSMPPDVTGLMLQQLAIQKRKAAEHSRLDGLKHFDEARAHLVSRFEELDAARDASAADAYLSAALRLARDLWVIGSRKTAWHRLMSSIHFSTTNGRSTAPELHVEAATELGRMMAEDTLVADALRELVGARSVAAELADHRPEKVAFYRTLAKAALRAGYDGDGNDAAQIVINLAADGSLREELVAELAESRLLNGSDVSSSPVVNPERERA